MGWVWVGIASQKLAENGFGSEKKCPFALIFLCFDSLMLAFHTDKTPKVEFGWKYKKSESEIKT